MKTGWSWKKMRIGGYLVTVCVVALFSGGCGRSSEDNESTESTLVVETVRENTVITQENIAEEVFLRIKDIDFTRRENPIDTVRYDSDTDKIYKAAFLKAVTNQIPIQYPDKEETVYYKALLKNAGELDEDGFQRYMKQSDYYYQDFDGDGLPELTVNTEGPCVLKYNPTEDEVELYYQKGQDWNLLGAGQMYYHQYVHGSDNIINSIYAFESTDKELGLQEVQFREDMTYDGTAWISTYMVSVGGYKDIELDEEHWGEIYRNFYSESVDLAPPSHIL